MKIMYHSFHKNINFDLKKKLNIKILKYIYFNIDNNEKKIIEQQINIFAWFLKDHVTLKPGVMMLKIQLWSQK